MRLWLGLAAAFVGLTVVLALVDSHGAISPTLERFPVFYRAVGLVVLGVWTWGFNIQYLALYGVAMGVLLQADGRPGTVGGAVDAAGVAHRPVYNLAAMLTAVYCGCLFLHTACAPWIPAMVIPVLLYTAFLAILVWPGDQFGGDLRTSFLRGTFRIATAPLWIVTFADILLADVYTSFAKVMADLQTPLCMIFSTTGFDYHQPVHVECSATSIAPIVTSLPSVWRFFQCLRQYRDEDRNPRHLLNALKYSTAFPVIILSAMQRVSPANEWSDVVYELWLLSLLVNSLYSFYWDVVHDWDLGHGNAAHPFLRDQLLFRSARFYYAAMAVNLFLRFSWSLKLSSHVRIHDDLSMFLFEVIEVLRRCLWIFLRSEHQYLRDEKAYRLRLTRQLESQTHEKMALEDGVSIN